MKLYIHPNHLVFMVLEGIAIGWILILAGVAMLVIETYNPGFFIAVPGTTLIILGILSLLFPGIFGSIWIVVIGVTVALISAGLTVWLYSRLTPDASPVTVSRDSLIGREGTVIRTVISDSISGKVTIGGVEWSARSGGDQIEAGKRVKVVDSEGVHIVVEEVK
jgi:membrane-bound ClpP family serine protease